MPPPSEFLRPRRTAGDPPAQGAVNAWPLWRGTIALLALAWLLRWAAPLLVPIATAVVLTLVLSAPVQALVRRGVPVVLGAGLVVGALAAGLAGLAFLLADQGLRHWRDGVGAAGGFAALLATLAAGEGVLAEVARWSLATRPTDPDVWVAAAAPLLWHGAVDAALTMSAVLLLLYFMLLSQRELVERLLRALPGVRARRRLLLAVRDCRRGIGHYLLVMTVVNVGLAVATGLVLWAIALPHALLWAVVTFVLAFVPYLGPLAVTAVLGLAGAAHFGPSTMLLAPPLAFLGLHAVEGNLINPWLMGRQLRLDKVAVLIAVMAGAWCWGLAGGLLAVPALIAADAGLRHARRRSVFRALVSVDGQCPVEQPATASSPARDRDGAASVRLDGAAALAARRPLAAVGPADLDDAQAGGGPAPEIEGVAPVVDRAQPQ